MCVYSMCVFFTICVQHIFAVYHWDLGLQKCVGKYTTSHEDTVWGVKYLNKNNISALSSSKGSGDWKAGVDHDFVSVGDDATIQLYY